jgi:hypothetical protein
VGADALVSIQTQQSLPTVVILLPVYPAKVLATIGLAAFFVQIVLNMVLYIKSNIASTYIEKKEIQLHLD